jgi:nucleotide-binding universal stress UspA family protein
MPGLKRDAGTPPDAERGWALGVVVKGVRQDTFVHVGSTSARPVLLCFDGSEDAIAAISRAGEMLAPRSAVVLTVWEPVRSWEPYDPATVVSAPLSRLASSALGLDEAVRDLARERIQQGIALAERAGFQSEARLEQGKPWRAICQTAEALDAEPIVVGARGLGRVESALLGSVSSAVVLHASGPVLVVPHHGNDQPAAGPTE